MRSLGLKWTYVHQFEEYRDYESTVFSATDEGRSSLDLTLTLVVGDEQKSAYVVVWWRNDRREPDQIGEFPLDWEAAINLLGDAYTEDNA